MDTYRKRRFIHQPLLYLSIIGLLGAVGTFVWNIWFGMAYTVVILITIFFAWETEKISYREIEKYLESLAFRMKKVGQEALLEMPIGMILMNDKLEIEWANPYMTKLMDVPDISRRRINQSFRRVPKPSKN